ncbi:hypothetical protein D3C78_908990 [compost metagenome]
MRGISKRRGRRPAPGPVRLNRGCDRRRSAIDGDRNPRTRLASTGQRWRIVIGVQNAVSERAGRDVVNQRRGWRDGIDGDGVNRAQGTDVTGRVDFGRRQLMLPFAQRSVWCKAPDAACNRSRPDLHAVIINKDRIAADARP